MKPSWDDAPEWAKWLAQDADGEWFWYSQKPVAIIEAEYDLQFGWRLPAAFDGQRAVAGIGEPPTLTLEPRP